MSKPELHFITTAKIPSDCKRATMVYHTTIKIPSRSIQQIVIVDNERRAVHPLFDRNASPIEKIDAVWSLASELDWANRAFPIARAITQYVSPITSYYASDAELSKMNQPYLQSLGEWGELPSLLDRQKILVPNAYMIPFDDGAGLDRSIAWTCRRHECVMPLMFRNYVAGAIDYGPVDKEFWLERIRSFLEAGVKGLVFWDHFGQLKGPKGEVWPPMNWKEIRNEVYSVL